MMNTLLRFLLFLGLLLTLCADDGTTYTPPSPDMNLQCSPPPQMRSIILTELYNGGGNEYFEMIEIYFNASTTISGWRLYFNDNNTHKYVNLGSGLGDVYYPDGTIGNDSVTTYPKGTIIVYSIDNIDPTNGEVFIANTTGSLSSNAAVVVDYFTYYKNSPLNYYITPSACSAILSDIDPNAQTYARYDTDGNFTQYYPGTNEAIEPSPGEDNSDSLPQDTTLSANASIEIFFSQSEIYSGENVTLTLRVTNPSTADISITDLNVTSMIPAGLSYLSHDGGTLLDPLLPSNPYGTVVSTSPQFFWRFINGLTPLSLPIGSSAQINLLFQVTAPSGSLITQSASLSTKQINNGTTLSSDTLTVLAYPPLPGRFDAWDTFRSINDHNISTKIIGKPFSLTIASLNATNTALEDFNGTVCAALTNSTGGRISEWERLTFSSVPTQNATFTYNHAIGGNDYAGVEIHSLWGVNESCPLSTEANGTTASDFFSIRPTSFSLMAPDAVAGEDFNITFNAPNFSTLTSADYNETVGNSFDVTYTEHDANCSLGTFNPDINNGWAFANGTKRLSTRYNEVGVVDVTISDIHKECPYRFSRVDCDDANVSDGINYTANLLPIGTAQTQIHIKPHHFDINATLHNFEEGVFTYLSRDLNISSRLDMNITAKNSEGSTTLNYDKECYAKNTTLTLPHSAIPAPLSQILYHENLTALDGNVTKNSPITLSFEPPVFTQGTAPLSLLINFDRLHTSPLNPFDFNISSATITDTDNIEGTTIPAGVATYLYGRARAYDITTDQNFAPNPIEFEVYSTLSSGYVSGMPQNTLQWYRNLHHDSAAQGSVLSGDDFASTTKIGASSTISIDTSVAPINGLHSIQIQNAEAIAHAIIHLEIPSWLWHLTPYAYDFATGTKCTQHPCFDYRFLGTAETKGVSSGTFSGSDFPITPAKIIIKKGEKLFR